jgi:hypothetical protein
MVFFFFFFQSAAFYSASSAKLDVFQSIFLEMATAIGAGDQKIARRMIIWQA